MADQDRASESREAVARELESARARAKFGDESRDPARMLAPPLADRYRAFLRAARERSALLGLLHSDLESLRSRRDRQRISVSECARLAEDNPQRIAETEKLADIEIEVSGAADEYAVEAARAAPLRAILNAVEIYIKNNPDALSLAAPIEVSASKRGGSFIEAVESLRAQLGEIRGLQAEVELAPLPSTEAKRRAAEQIAALADRGRVDVAPLIDSGRPFRFCEMPAHDQVRFGLSGHAAFVDSIATLAWLFEEQLLAKVYAEIDANADDENALMPKERAEKFAALKREALGLERQEEALICAAAEIGQIIPRRADADPRAILGCNGPEPQQSRRPRR